MPGARITSYNVCYTKLLREAGDYRRLGTLMNVCQGLLNAIGVSTPQLESMIDVARRAGAAGAKLTSYNFV